VKTAFFVLLGIAMIIGGIVDIDRQDIAVTLRYGAAFSVVAIGELLMFFSIAFAIMGI